MQVLEEMRIIILHSIHNIFELMKHVGIYFLNGVSPSPRAELKMKPQAIDPFFNGNVIVYNAMGSNTQHCCCCFKCFFSIQDPHIAIPSRATHHNWKIEHILVNVEGRR